jgi:hypothetical protein
LAALRKASGKHGAFKGNVPDRWGVYPSRTASHAPADRGAAVAAALDRAAFALSGDDARLSERRAAEAEAAAEAARAEVCATATRLETILNEGKCVTRVRDDTETRLDTRDATPRTPAAAASAAPAVSAPLSAPLSATPSAKARAFAADVAGAVRDTEQTVTRDASVAAAAAALAKALVEATKTREGEETRESRMEESSNREMSFGALERALGAVSGLLTRAARGATGARALDLPGLIEDQRAEIERVCAAACAEDA